MSILNNYIVSRILKSYLSILITLLSLYVISDMIFNFGDYLKHAMPFTSIALMYLYSLPQIFLLLSPFCLLISVVYCFADLNKNNEILGIRTLGFSMFRLSLPALICALLLSVAAFTVQEKMFYSSQKKVSQIKTEFITDKEPLSAKVMNNVAFRHGNLVLFISRFIPREQTLSDVIIFKIDQEGNITEKLFSKSIIYIQGTWIALDLTAYTLDEEGKFVDRPYFFTDKEIKLDITPRDLAVHRTVYSGFPTAKDLIKEIQRMKKARVSQVMTSLIVDLHRHAAEPLAHFFLVIGVLPFALEIKKRKAGVTSLATGFIFGFIYFFIFNTSIALGKAETIIPWLSAWVAPLFFLVIGVSAPRFMR